MLRPKVILLCQCLNTGTHGEASDTWSSSFRQAADYDIVLLRNGHSCFRVKSFHPMYFRYIDGDEQPLKRVLSEYLFDTTFVIAANLLAGRELSGFGLLNLKESARHGPVISVSQAGVVVSYRYVSERSCCSEQLWAFFEEVGVLHSRGPATAHCSRNTVKCARHTRLCSQPTVQPF